MQAYQCLLQTIRQAEEAAQAAWQAEEEAKVARQAEAVARAAQQQAEEEARAAQQAEQEASVARQAEEEAQAARRAQEEAFAGALAAQVCSVIRNYIYTVVLCKFIDYCILYSLKPSALQQQPVYSSQHRAALPYRLNSTQAQ